MDLCAKVESVMHLGGRSVRVLFSDGVTKDVDFLSTWSGLNGVSDVEKFFAETFVDPIAKTLCWPNGVDVDPEILYGDFEPISGRFFTVLL